MNARTSAPLKQAATGEGLVAADLAGQVYRLKPRWRRFMRAAAVLLCLTGLGLPFGIWFFIVAGKAKLVATDQGFVLKMFTTKVVRWEQVEAVDAADAVFIGGGLLDIAVSNAVAKRTAGLKGPLFVQIAGKRTPLQLPAQSFEDSVRMAQTIERYTGLTVLPEASDS